MNLRHALIHSFLWRKDFFFTYLLLIACCSFYYNFSPVKHPVLDAGCLIVTFFFCCSGLKSDNYSWKYFQALPLSRRELFHFFILNQLQVMLPLLIWVLTFFSAVMEFLGVPYKGMNLSLFIGTILVYFAGSLFLGIAAFYGAFEGIRAPYAKTSGLIPFLQTIRNALYYFTGFIVVTFAGAFVLSLLFEKFPFLSTLFLNVYTLWIAVFLALGIYYKFVFRRWRKEELSYTKINFRVIRDVPIMLFLVLTSSFISGSLDSDAPRFYGDSDFLERINQREAQLLRKVSEGKISSKQLNQSSNTGMTPLMAAAHSGNIHFFKKLEEAGAKRAGTVRYPKNQIIDGSNILMLAVSGKSVEIVKRLLESEDPNATNGRFSVLHLASFVCSPEIADLLLQKGANVNALNVKGQSPLHIASRDNCLPVVVSLLEGGADPMIKDKTGKLARDYIKRQNDRLRIGYYLEKKMRSPAGK